MKKNLLLLSVGVLLFSFFSCKKVENFLDKPPGVDVNEDLIFSARVQTEKYVADMYQLGITCPLPIRATEAGFGGGLPATGGGYGGNLNTPLIGITDEGEASEGFAVIQGWNSGNITPLNIVANEDERYFMRWQAIRAANIIIERINQVPDADQSYKDMVTGEALFIRALNDFEMLKRYGGFPIVNKRIVTPEDSKIERNTFEECVNTIVKDCDNAVLKLPANQPGNFAGRAHKGAALALKARTMLYAASPLFNAAAPPVSFGNAQDDKLLVYGNYDLNRWKGAADAAKAVLDWAQAKGYALIDVPANRIPVITPGGIVNGNYRAAWQTADNPEIILSSKIYGTAKGVGQFPWAYVVPNSLYIANSGAGWTAPTVTFNFVRKYEKRDGTRQTWNYAGGNDLLQKYNELDPRFAQTVIYEGARLHNNATRVQIWDGGATPKALSNSSTCKGGHWMLKYIPDGLGTTGQIPVCPVFRVNEMLLSYAEALNEFSGPTAEAFDALNKIRIRSGMPNLPTTLTQSQFRDKVHNERDIELALEDHRLNDIRRWKVAEQDGGRRGNCWGLQIKTLDNASPFPTAFGYLPFVFETRVWTAKEYFFPFDNNEVLKGTLKQNPGW